jgi:preprotein translocase subunit SecD
MLLGIVGGALTSPSAWHKNFKVGLGLDLTSGTTVTLQADKPAAMSNTEFTSAMGTAVSIMNSRVNGAGFTGATVVPQGSNLITVTVPNEQAAQVEDLVGTTAQLRFREVLLAAPNYATSASATPTATSAPSAGASPTPSANQLATTTDPSASGKASLLTAKTTADFGRLNCSGKDWQEQIYGTNASNWDNPDAQIVACYHRPAAGVEKLALDKSTVSGDMLQPGKASESLQTNGKWWVNLTFNAQGAKAFGALSTKMYDSYCGGCGPNTPAANELDYFAIVLDGAPQAVPFMASVLPSGTAQIQGAFTQSQASQLVDVLNYGALPLAFQQISVQSITAQVGASQLHAGLIAATAGLTLVVCYVFLYYRGLGIVSVSSLAIAALLSYLSVALLSKYENFALNLAGIAGLIVAIGITADSFVVFFERLRDEVREGTASSLRTAVEHGWARARRTILVSDTVSFIAAALLWKLAIGDARDFGFTLGLTTLVDIIVVFLFTKPMVTLLARTRFFGSVHRLLYGTAGS